MANQEANTSIAIAPKPRPSRRVLVVDDEISCRDVISALLQHIGHCCQTATGAAEALRHFVRTEFDLVVTDLNMPEMTGVQLAEKIKAQNPLIPVLLISGSLPLEIPPSIDRVLAKPFSLQQLRAAIASLD